jgi:outer membrane autotransporter protein
VVSLKGAVARANFNCPSASGHENRRGLLATAAVLTTLAAYGRSAYGQQVCEPNVASPNFLCDGPSDDTQDLTNGGLFDIANVITGTEFEVDTTAEGGSGGSAVTITGDGAVSYTDTNYSPLTAVDIALDVTSSKDFDGGNPGSVTVNTNGALTGGVYGIRAFNSGSSSLSVIANGHVTGANRGIDARNTGTNLEVTTGPDTDVTGGNFGIFAYNYGNSSLSVIANGDVHGNSGIFALNKGNNLEVTTGADTDVTGSIGIAARNEGSGTAAVIANGDVNGSITGIFAQNYGSGTLTVITDGDVTGTTYDGINAQQFAGGPIAVTVGTASTVTTKGVDADDFAIDIIGGPADIKVAGTLNGGAGGAVQFDQGTARDDRLELQPTAIVNGSVLAGPAGTDTLAFGGAGNGVFDLSSIDDESGPAEQYRDFEMFEVESGTWSFSGATQEDFTVNGGTITGTGTFGGLIVNGGVLAPGNSIGTMTVDGNLSLSAGAIFEVEVDAAGQSDKVIVNGTVNLTGATLRVLAADGDYAPSTDYTIIENDGADAVLGQFSTVTSSLAFLTPTVFYTGGDGNDVVLSLARNETLFPDVARTRNQRAVAGALEQFPTDNPLFLAVLNQTEAGARQAFDALSGEIHATVSGTLADDSRYVREAVLGRLMQASHTGADTQVAALAHAGPQVASLDANAMALGYGSKSLGEAMPAYQPAPLAFWTRAYGAWGDFKGDGNAATADRDLGGFVSGMDAQVSGSWRVGLATGASFSNVDVDARYSSADVESYHLGGYLGGVAGAFALRGGGMWAWNDVDSRRAVIFPGFFERQRASYDEDTGQIFGEVAYPTQMAGVAFEPFAGLAVVSIDGGSFRERGGALASLRGSSADQDVGFSTLGLRAATAMHWGAMRVTPHVSAAWQHAFDDVTPGAALAFASTGIGFGVSGVPLPEDSALIDAGLNFALGTNTTAGVSYTGQFGDGVSDNGVKGRVTWLF